MYPGRLDELIALQEQRIKSMVYSSGGMPSFLPIVLKGGAGDVILSISTLRRLKKEGYQMWISSPHAEVLRYFCKDIPIQADPLPGFAWHLEIDSVAHFKFQSEFGGFLLPEHKALFEQQRQWFGANPGMEYLVQKHPRDKYCLARRFKEMAVTVATSGAVSLGYSGVEVFRSARTASIENYITIHDGYDANSPVSGRATKTWKWESWNALVRRLHCDFPKMEIIQVGSKTSRIIDGIDRDMVNKTTLAEAFDLISRARLHIDTDSGLVHAATTMGVPCIVMFGPTPKAFYGHPENANVSCETSCSGGCFHLTRNWMDKCPVGYQTPRCMDDVGAEAVMARVGDLLK